MSSDQLFRVGDIQHNPFRDVGRYLLEHQKVAQLRESIRATGWWANVVARLRGDGLPEIAYGHHRLEALRQEQGLEAQVALIIRPLSDDEMLRIMVNENLTEWSASALVEQESVRAVVLAYSVGKIVLSPPEAKVPKNKYRYAPSFVCGGNDPDGNLDHPYTSATLAQYLGWKAEKVRIVLQALELQERGWLTAMEYAERSPTQARFVTTHVRDVVGRFWAIEQDFLRQAREARRHGQEELAAAAMEQAEATRHRCRSLAQYVGQKAWFLIGVDDHGKTAKVLDRLLAPNPRASRLVDDDVADLIDGPSRYRRGSKAPSSSTDVQVYFDHLTTYSFAVGRAQDYCRRFSPAERQLLRQQHDRLREQLNALDAVLTNPKARPMAEAENVVLQEA